MSELLREAEMDSSNDELYMGENIGPIVTGDALPAPQPIMGDINEDNVGSINQDQPGTLPPSTTAPVSTLGTPSMASTWRASNYIEAIQKEASDSDLYTKGYQDRVTGKSMDEGLANLSLDYYQGYEQGALYNEKPLITSPPELIEDVRSKTIATREF